jgi:chorismate mutase/prephenate dehydratase
MNNSFSKKQVRVAYLGPDGTFSHQVAQQVFDPANTFHPFHQIQEVFKAVKEGKSDFGIVPVENSTQGSIPLVLDLMFQESQNKKLKKEDTLKLYGEVTIPILHNLVGNPGTKIQDILKIYAHPQALAQCRLWLERFCPKASLDASALSNVEAILKIARHPKSATNVAAIAPAKAALDHGCILLAKAIQDIPSNKTRFWILSKENPPPSKKYKTSLVFFCHDKPGALLDVLKIFKTHNINLTKIESRPSRKKNWEYYFFVDFFGHANDLSISKALKALEKKTLYAGVLGSYAYSLKAI